ncbi:nuclear hormone receptor HR96-like [Ylistrum balloti]|uniref:nuclear hormone receptor HR96-like n=1 Tax=Ylistrum balloti TaxID=509963 RepID=UPI0029059F09|nr:nuclear hormone receptor HR96-like [Ylistrum balloti]
MKGGMECDSQTSDWTVTSLSNSKKDKLCLVCGDKALGYNFNAVSCESCKAFFRRNAHKTIRGRCEGKCDVNVESRSFCKRCRLQKCFIVGMRKDMILNEQQKKIRKQKIIINKLKKHGQIPQDESCAGTSEDLTEEIEAKICSQSLDELRSSFPNLSEKDLGMLTKLKQENKEDKSLSSSPDAQSCPSWTDSKKDTEDVISLMSEMNRSLVRELVRANEDSAFLANTSTEIRSIPTNATEFINVAEGFVRRVIKLAKSVEFFKMVKREDQIALLKGSVTEIMMLRSAVNYDVATESWSLSTKSCLNKDMTTKVPLDGSSGNPSVSKIGAELLKKGSSEMRAMFMSYSTFIKALMRTIKGDVLMLKLLIMLSLFSSDRQGLEEKQKIEEIQEYYAQILQSYISIRFPHNKVLFAKILMKLTDLRDINELHTKMLLQMKVESIEPLLVEIFDLPV